MVFIEELAGCEKNNSWKNPMSIFHNVLRGKFSREWEEKSWKL